MIVLQRKTYIDIVKITDWLDAESFRERDDYQWKVLVDPVTQHLIFQIYFYDLRNESYFGLKWQ